MIDDRPQGHGKVKDLSGQWFGDLQALEPERQGTERGWRCFCRGCGGTTWKRTSRLTTGQARSCGCQRMRGVEAARQAAAR